MFVFVKIVISLTECVYMRVYELKKIYFICAMIRTK